MATVGSSGCGLATATRASRISPRSRGWLVAVDAPLVGNGANDVQAMVPGPGRLTLADREEITLGLHAGESFTAIAARLGKAVSTVSREVAGQRRPGRLPGVAGASAGPRAGPAAQDAASWPARSWRPRSPAGWPSGGHRQQISRRLRIEFPGDPMMRVSHETIYQALYVQGRGELRRELARCLRTGRAKRRPRGRDGRHRARSRDMVMISERPAEAADRAVPGHWEGDLIIGKDGRSAVGTLVERTTRYVLLLHLPDGRDAAPVEQAMRQAITALPAELARTITWDQGKEMACHADFTIATGIPVYFCDPHTPWQRGSNENTNGLLRQYLPKGTDLSVHSAADLARIAASLNGRPRKTLGYMTPSEKLAELLAHTG